MSFTTLDCKDFGKFQDRTFILRPTTLFYGENEAGKTTLCDAFLFALCGENGRFGIFRRYGKAKAQLSPKPSFTIEPHAALELNVIRAAEFGFVLDGKASWQRNLQQKLFAAGLNPDALIRAAKTSQRRHAIPKERLQELARLEQAVQQNEQALQHLARKQQELHNERQKLASIGEQLHIAEQHQAKQKLAAELLRTHQLLTQALQAQVSQITDQQLLRIDLRQLQQSEYERKLHQRWLQNETESYHQAKQRHEVTLREEGRLEQQLADLLGQKTETQKAPPHLQVFASIALIGIAASFYVLSLNTTAAAFAFVVSVLLGLLVIFLLRRHREESTNLATKEWQQRQRELCFRRENAQQERHRLLEKITTFEQRQQEFSLLEHTFTESLTLAGYTTLEELELAREQASLRQRVGQSAAKDLEHQGIATTHLKSSLQHLESKLRNLTVDRTEPTMTAETLAEAQKRLFLQEREVEGQLAKMKAQAELLPEQQAKDNTALQKIRDEIRQQEKQLQAHDMVLQIFAQLQRDTDSDLEQLGHIATDLLRRAGLTDARDVNVSKWKNDGILARDHGGTARPIDNLSSSTQALYYLALRLAALTLLEPNNTFLLLDEPFAHFDLPRTEQALKLLKVAQERHHFSLFFFSKDPLLATFLQATFPETIIHQLTPLAEASLIQPSSQLRV